MILLKQGENNMLKIQDPRKNREEYIKILSSFLDSVDSLEMITVDEFYLPEFFDVLCNYGSEFKIYPIINGLNFLLYFKLNNKNYKFDSFPKYKITKISNENLKIIDLDYILSKNKPNEVLFKINELKENLNYLISHGVTADEIREIIANEIFGKRKILINSTREEEY